MSAQKDETTLTENDVRREHMRAVQPGGHWAYLFGVVGMSVLLMIAFMAFLEGASA